jgi:flagellar basal body-associated protein FliL
MATVSQSTLLIFIFAGMGVCILAILVYMAFILFQRHRKMKTAAEKKSSHVNPDAWRTRVYDVFPDYKP